MTSEPPSDAGDADQPGAGDPGAGEPGDESTGAESTDDPFAGLTLDESFVASAAITEPAAADRESELRERAARQANLQRLLADQEAQRANEQYERHRFAPPDEWDDDYYDDDDTVRRSGRGHTVRVVAIIVVIALVVVYVVSQFVGGGTEQVTTPTQLERTPSDDPIASAGPSDPRVDLIRPTTWPPKSTESSPTPIGVPAPVPNGGGPHEFLQLQPDGVSAVAYDPCRPIHYVTRPSGPPEGDVLIRESIAAVSAATGLRFVDDGTTQEGPSDTRAAYQPEIYGERWAPVLFTWSDPVESPRLGEVTPEAPQANPAAYAGSTAVGIAPGGGTRGASTEGGEDPQLVFVTGSVTLDAADLTEMAGAQDGRARARAVIQHEIGHLVGLGHVDDTAQLMFPTINPNITGFNDGDLEGLAALGRGACFPEL